MFKRWQSIFLDDGDAFLSDKIEKPYRLTPFIVTFCTGIITDIDMRHLIELGLHVIRFKMSNITRRDKIKLLTMLKTAVGYCCEKYEVSTWPIAISIDLPHSCIRTGCISEGPQRHFDLEKGNTVEITSNIKYSHCCSNTRIFIDDQEVIRSITEGTEITLNHGNISLICTKAVDFQTIQCKILKGGTLYSREYVCIRGVKRNTSENLNKIDLELIEFAKEFNLDIITIKVVHDSIILNKVRAMFTDRTAPLLISTICDQEGLDNVDEIIKESDGIILAREFLAFQITDIYQMPAIQLQIGAKCRKLGKPFYISGNILEITLLEGKVSYGDISDITNAVACRTGFVLQNYHDTDNLIQAVKILDSVCRSVESRIQDKESWITSTEVKIPVTAAEACILGCTVAATQVKALVIILPTVTGRTALQLSSVATDKIILTISSSETVARKLQLCYGIIPIIYDKKAKKDWQEEMAARIRFAVSYGVKHKLLKYGSKYLVLRKSNPKSSFADTIHILTASIEDLEQEQICPSVIDKKEYL